MHLAYVVMRYQPDQLYNSNQPQVRSDSLAWWVKDLKSLWNFIGRTIYHAHDWSKAMPENEKGFVFMN